MGDTFTVYRVQPTPRTIANVESGRLVDIGSSRELQAAQQKGMTVEEFKKLRSVNQGKWWSASLDKTKNYNKQYINPKKPLGKNRIPGSEVIKRKVSIDQWIKGWKELHLFRYKGFGHKVTSETLDRLNKEAANMKKLFKSNRKQFLKSASYATEAFLDNIGDARTSIMGTWSMNKGRAVEQAAKTVGKGILKTVAGPAGIALTAYDMYKAGIFDDTGLEDKTFGGKNVGFAKGGRVRKKKYAKGGRVSKKRSWNY